MVDIGPKNDFTHRNTTQRTRDLILMARLLKEARGSSGLGDLRRQRDADEHYGFHPEYR